MGDLLIQRHQPRLAALLPLADRLQLGAQGGDDLAEVIDGGGVVPPFAARLLRHAGQATRWVTDAAGTPVDPETEPSIVSQAMVVVAERTEARLVEAMLECIGRWGLTKTTADDIARAAGVSRATLYRAFPGGKDVALEAVLRHEVARFLDRLGRTLDEAESLEDLLVAGALEAAAFLRGHDALSYVLHHEREQVLPTFALHRLDKALTVATSFIEPHLARFVSDRRHTPAAADVLVRLLVSFALDPSPTVDLADPRSVRRFVKGFVLPMLAPAHHPAP